MKYTTKQATDKLNNPSVIFEAGKVKIIPCFKTLQAAMPFLKHVGKFYEKKTKKLVILNFWYNDVDGFPRKSQYSYPPKDCQLTKKPCASNQ